MKILIAGCGKVGEVLIKQLVAKWLRSRMKEAER